MSIIIKGLNLPPVSDTNGIINLSIDCYGQVVIHNTYPTKILKAEQVPKHERLIDADALIVDLMDRGVEGLQTDDWYEIQQVVADAPTVIEAEDKE